VYTFSNVGDTHGKLFHDHDIMHKWKYGEVRRQHELIQDHCDIGKWHRLAFRYQNVGMLGEGQKKKTVKYVQKWTFKIDQEEPSWHFKLNAFL
jgi:hypothetical protein